MADKGLEYGIPKCIEEAIEELKSNENSTLKDWYYCQLYSEINSAEVGQAITSEQAWYLRGKYLGLERQER